MTTLLILLVIWATDEPGMGGPDTGCVPAVTDVNPIALSITISAEDLFQTRFNILLLKKINLSKNGHILVAATAVEPVPSILSLIIDRAGGAGPLPQVTAGAGVCLTK